LERQRRCYGQLPTPGDHRNALRQRSGPSRPKVGTIEQDDDAWLARAVRTEQVDRLDNHDQEWGRKGATLSDKTARKEDGLTEDEIIDAVNAGSLDYRVGSVYGTRGSGSFRAWSFVPSPPSNTDLDVLECSVVPRSYNNDISTPGRQLSGVRWRHQRPPGRPAPEGFAIGPRRPASESASCCWCLRWLWTRSCGLTRFPAGTRCYSAAVPVPASRKAS
jgi:hypothetical protein